MTARPITKALTKTELKTLNDLLIRKEMTDPKYESFINKHTPNKVPKFAEPDEVKAILNQRGSRYGDFTDHARLAQQLQACLREHKVPGIVVAGGIASYHQPYLQLDSVKKQSLTVICDKLARILNGDPEYDDNWYDIEGYARLARERLHPRDTASEQ